MPPSRSHRSLLVVLAAILALVLSACGGGPAETARNADGSIDLSSVELVVGSPCKTCLQQILKASGEDKDVAYKLEYADFDSTGPLIEALKADRVDVGLGGETGVFFGLANGAEISFLAGVAELDRAGSEILVKGDSPLRTVADLRGKKVALPFYTKEHYQFAKTLEAAGLAWGDVTVLDMDTTAGLSALNNGDVDAFAVWDPNSAVAETEYGARSLANMLDAANLPNALYARNGALADPGKKAALEDLTRRVTRAHAWMNTNRDPWAQGVTDLSSIPAAASKLATSRSTVQVVPVDTKVVEGWQGEVDYFFDQKQFTTNFAVKDHVAVGFDQIVSDELKKLGAQQ